MGRREREETSENLHPGRYRYHDRKKFMFLIISSTLPGPTIEALHNIFRRSRRISTGSIEPARLRARQHCLHSVGLDGRLGEQFRDHSDRGNEQNRCYRSGSEKTWPIRQRIVLSVALLHREKGDTLGIIVEKFNF